MMLSLATAVPASEPVPSLPVHADGLGAFRLGAPLVSAAKRMAHIDRAALHMGPGCDEREQSVVTAAVAGVPATIMAMADTQGRISEVVASAPHQGAAVDLLRCQAQAQRWARALAPRWGVGATEAPVRRGAATLTVIRLSAQGRVEARWFAGGRSCDLSVHFEPATARVAAR
ncbi:MAG: hypothetical protein ACKO1H_15080 [Tabrizicola sp.]